MGPHQAKKPLHRKENYQQNEKTTYEMGENIANHISDKGLISNVHKELTQLNSQKNLIKKMGSGSEYTFFQRRPTDDKLVDEHHYSSAK